MALTAAEKQKRYRERKKAELGESVLKQKESIRKRAAREKNGDAIRQKEREYKRQYRASKKAAEAAEASASHTEPQRLSFQTPSCISCHND